MSPFALAAVIGFGPPSEAPASSPRATADGDPLPLPLGALPLPLARVYVSVWIRCSFTCPRVKGDEFQRPYAPGAGVERALAEVHPPRIWCRLIPSLASIMRLSSPNLPRSASLRADRPVLVVHVVGQVRLLLWAMRGGLDFLRVDLPALVLLPLTGRRRAKSRKDPAKSRKGPSQK